MHRGVPPDSFAFLAMMFTNGLFPPETLCFPGDATQQSKSLHAAPLRGIPPARPRRCRPHPEGPCVSSRRSFWFWEVARPCRPSTPLRPWRGCRYGEVEVLYLCDK
jgi:hypothetical protein